MEESFKTNSDQFFKLFIENQKKIFSYILMLVPNSTDADDILQETASVMWKKFDSFTPDTNFSAWGITIARNTIYNYSKRKKRDNLLFVGDMLEVFSDAASSTVQNVDSRLQHLENCIKNLPEKDRNLLRLKYEQGYTIKEISLMVERPLQGLYKAYQRVHHSLLICIRRKSLSQEHVE